MDFDLESEDEEDDSANPLVATPIPGPVSSAKKRSWPPDGQDDSLPVFSFSSPISPLASISQRASSKRPKLG
jgi:hypothetical protein